MTFDMLRNNIELILIACLMLPACQHEIATPSDITIHIVSTGINCAHAELSGVKVLATSDQQRRLQINMGQKNTAGYAISLQRAQILDRVLILNVNWIEPQPGMMTAQMLTQPCVVMQLPQQEIDSVRVMDQNGVVRIEQEF